MADGDWETPDKEEEDAFRALLPEWQTNGNLAIVEDPDGEPVSASVPCVIAKS